MPTSAKDAVEQPAVVDRISDLVVHSEGLAVFATHSPRGRMVTALINAGPFTHPITGDPVIAHIAMGNARRIQYLESDAHAVIVFHHHRRWLTVEGTATLLGPDRPHPAVRPERIPALLREIFRVAGGGEHPDWDEYDRVMAAERRTAVFVTIDRSYGTYWSIDDTKR